MTLSAFRLLLSSNGHKTVRLFYSSALLLLVVCLFSEARAQESTKLEPNKPIERTLKGGETAQFEIKIKRGQFIRIECEPTNIDLVLTLADEDGKTVVEMDGDSDYLWRESISAIAEKGGKYNLQIKGVGPTEFTGSVVVKIAELRRAEVADRKRIEAEQALSRAIKLSKENKQKESTEAFEVVTRLWHEIGDKYWEAVSIWNLAWAYHFANRDDDALKLHNQALATFQELKDRVGEASALGGIGVIYSSAKNNVAAKDKLEKSLAIARELKRPRSEFKRLSALVSVYFSLNQSDLILESLNRMLEISVELKRRDGQRGTLDLLGSFLYLQNDFSRAQKYMEQALEIDRELKDTPGQIIRLTGLVHIYDKLEKGDLAEKALNDALVLAVNAKDQRTQGNVLKDIGSRALLRRHDCDRARKILLQALQNLQEAADKDAQGSVLDLLATASMCLGDNDKVIEYSSRGYEIKKASNDYIGQVSALSSLGIGYFNSGQVDKAFQEHERALAIARDQKLKFLESQSLESLSEDYAGVQNYQKATEMGEQALAIARELKEEGLIQSKLRGLGNYYLFSGQYDKAQKKYEEALKRSSDAKDKDHESSNLHSLGLLFARKRQFDRALEFFDRGLRIARDLGFSDRTIYLLSSIGAVHVEQSQFEIAIKTFEEAYAQAKSEGTLHWQSSLLVSLGRTYSKLGQFENAQGSFEQALAVAQESKDRMSQAIVQLALGHLYLGLNQYEKALDKFKEVEKIARETKSRWLLGFASEGMGTVNTDLSQNQKAQGNYEQSLALMKEVFDRTNEGNVLNVLGNTYLNLKEYDKALSYYEQSLAVARELKNKQSEVFPLVNLGVVFQKKDQFEKAKVYFEQGLSLATEVKDRLNQGYALRGLGEISFKQKKFTQAGDYYHQSLPIAREIQSKKLEGSVLQDLMDLEKEVRTPQLAILYGKLAVNAYQEIRENIKGLDKESQQSFLKDKEPAYRTLAAILISQHRLPEARTILDLLKEEEFSSPGSPRGNGEVVLFAKAEARAIEAADRTVQIGREYDDLFRRRESLDEPSRLRMKALYDELGVANGLYEKALAALSANVQRGDRYEVVSKEAKAFQSDLRELGAGTAALYTLLVTNEQGETTNGLIILLTPSFEKAYAIDVTDFDSTVRDLQIALKNPNLNPLPLAQRLYRMIFMQPSSVRGTTLAADLDTYFKGREDKTLMWHQDGVLRYLPMAALHDGKQYLVEKYRNTVFSRESGSRLKSVPSVHWTALGLGVSEPREEAGLKFPALPGSQEELKRIIRNENSPQGILPGIVKVDRDFTREAVVDELLFDSHPVVHISSHYSFQPADPEHSFLLLGQGRWTVGEMRKETTLFTGVDLVTLSACDTAMGQANGKDVEGFAFKVQELGAQAVIASLWPVDDIGTQVLMPLFYRLRETGMTKAEAFQRAQLALLHNDMKDALKLPVTDGSGVSRSELVGGGQVGLYARDPQKPFAHPYYWAPFILIGNWK